MKTLVSIDTIYIVRNILINNFALTTGFFIMQER